MADFGNEYDEALRLLLDVLAHRTDYALIGGLAVSFRSTPRSTRDIDLLLSLPRTELARFLETVRNEGFRCDVRTDSPNSEMTIYLRSTTSLFGWICFPHV